jgi:hypothetical protein
MEQPPCDSLRAFLVHTAQPPQMPSAPNTHPPTHPPTHPLTHPPGQPLEPQEVEVFKGKHVVSAIIVVHVMLVGVIIQHCSTSWCHKDTQCTPASC